MTASQPPCKASVSRQPGWPGNCLNRAVKDGCCKIHHPDYIKAKRDKWRAQFDSRSREDDMITKQASALCARLGCDGGVYWNSFTGRVSRAIIITFEVAEQIAERLENTTRPSRKEKS